MINGSALPDATLSSEEMPNFYAAGPYTVGRDSGGRVAHIYRGKFRLGLCEGHYRTRWDVPPSYVAGDKTCKRCLVIYRRLN